jgi:WD40 repeat protein
VTIDATRVAVASRLGAIHVIDITRKGVSFPLLGHVGTVNCIASDGRNIVSGGSDTIVECWWLDDPLIAPHRIPSFGGEISCVAVSREFNIHVSGNIDGAIFIVATRTGAVTRVISLGNNGIAKRILITKEWGFIVAYVTEMVDGKLAHLLFVWSINGELIRRVPITCAVVAWVTWSSLDGFDFVLMADEMNRLFEFEVFWVNLGNGIDVKMKVDSLYCDGSCGIIGIMGKNGQGMLTSKLKRLGGNSP